MYLAKTKALKRTYDTFQLKEAMCFFDIRNVLSVGSNFVSRSFTEMLCQAISAIFSSRRCYVSNWTSLISVLLQSFRRMIKLSCLYAVILKLVKNLCTLCQRYQWYVAQENGNKYSAFVLTNILCFLT